MARAAVGKIFWFQIDMKYLQYLPEAIHEYEHNPVLKKFLLDASNITSQRILEIGTCQHHNRPTHHKALFPNAERYVCGDIQHGTDVDVICDAHNLERSFLYGEFNIFIACSVWEHLKRPWIAAESVLNILPIGGIFFIQAPFAFPEHAYPNDFFRFTRSGLESLFSHAGLLQSCYDWAADLKPHDSRIDWNHAAPNYLSVCLFGIK